MTTYWLLGENSQDNSEIYDKNVEYEFSVDTHTENLDEGFDDLEEVTCIRSR